MRVIFVTKTVGKDMLHITSIRETQIHRIIIDNTMIEIILSVLPYILIGNAIFDFILYFSKYVFDFVNNNLNNVLQPSFRESTILHGAMRMSAGIAPSKVTRILALFSYIMEWIYVYGRVKKLSDCLEILLGLLPLIVILSYDVSLS